MSPINNNEIAMIITCSSMVSISYAMGDDIVK